MKAGVSKGRVSRDMLMYTCRTAGLREDYRMTPFRVMILLRRATNTDEMSLVYVHQKTYSWRALDPVLRVLDFNNHLRSYIATEAP